MSAIADLRTAKPLRQESMILAYELSFISWVTQTQAIQTQAIQTQAA